MWAVKIYAMVWLLAAVAAAVTLLSGFSNEVTQMIFGLFFVTLAAAGFVMVLPAWVDEHFAPKY